MIEIKFRVWDTLREQMILNAHFCFDLFAKDPERYKFQQYTGLKDKGGREVYEGDIIDYRFQGLKYALIVKWDNDCACFGLYRPDTLMAKAHFHYDSIYTEIIGNIYENGDLLK
jgi:uncharacterized phage protein (TIGR01671 family)